MLKQGALAPDFELPDETGTPHRLTDLLAQSRVLLYFYPADFTPVCTAQACALRDVLQAVDAPAPAAELVAPDVRVVGISTQGADSHSRFKAQYSLPFTLLSDVDKTVVRAYGVNGPLGFGVRRATFLLNQDQIVANRVVSDLFVGPHSDLLKGA